jgi:hypothetical protein
MGNEIPVAFFFSFIFPGAAILGFQIYGKSASVKSEIGCNRMLSRDGGYRREFKIDAAQ